MLTHFLEGTSVFLSHGTRNFRPVRNPSTFYVSNLPSHLYLKLDFSIGHTFLGLFLSFQEILVEFVIQEIPIFPILQMLGDHIPTNEIGFEHTFQNKFPQRISGI